MTTNLPSLQTETIWAILNEEIDDTTVNQLVWHYLGYRYDSSTQEWNTAGVSQEWREEYPQPPDFINSRPATVKLTRSIPPENKQLLKEKLGFKGYKIGEFGPRQTRRATAANWLLCYIQGGHRAWGMGAEGQGSIGVAPCYHALHGNALQEALPSLSHKHETESHLRHSKPETWNEF